MISKTMDRFLFAAVAALFAVGAAHAQEAAPADGGEAAPAEGAGPEQGSETAAAEAEDALRDDLDLIWGERRKIQVVQKRLHEKEGRLEITAFGSTIPNDDFIIYYPLGARVGYHFSEAFDVEASFAYAIANPTELTTFLEAQRGSQQLLKNADILEEVNFYYGVNLLWAPVYGKISLLGTKLTHFDTYIGLGGGVFHTTEFDTNGPVGGNKAFKPSGNTVLGFRWFLGDQFTLRTEYRHFFFQKFKGGISKPVELSLGLGFLI